MFICFSEESETDFEAIARYTRDNWGGIEKALEYTESLKASIQKEKSPYRLGIKIIQTMEGTLYKLPLEHHTAIYLDDGERILIIRVLHNRQSLEKVISVYK